MHSKPLEPFVSQLSRHTSLTEDERAALLNLSVRGQHLLSNHTIFRREEVVRNTCVVLSGLLARTGLTKEGGRQITSFYVKGEVPDLHTLVRPKTTFELGAVTESEIVLIPHSALQELVSKYPGISEAFCRELVRESDIIAEWVVNVGRRTAKQRIAHLFCEMAVKSRAATEKDASFPFPVTQASLADATGLSVVHVNRSLMALRHDGVLRFEHGQVDIPDWPALRNAAGFESGYLEAECALRFTPEQRPPE